MQRTPNIAEHDTRQRIIAAIRRRYGLSAATAAYVAEQNYRAAVAFELPAPATRVRSQRRRSA